MNAISVTFLILICAIGNAGAQTISPLFFGNNEGFPSTTGRPMVFSSIQRQWTTFATTAANYCLWSDVETSRGVFNWTACDEIINDFIAQGADIEFTFGGYVPGWANANAGPSVPPTSATDFYDWVTAVVTRYKGKVKYYEPWNEVNDSTNPTGWQGTVSQMITYTQNVQSIVHSIDPDAISLSPSVTWQSGLPYFQALLVAGIAPFCDQLNYHAYPTQENNPVTLPEQTWNIAAEFAAMFSFYSVGSIPIVVTEGGYLSNVYVTSVAAQTNYTAAYLALLASAGISRQLWFQYDGAPVGSTYFGTLWDTKNYLNTTGVAYRNMATWLSGATFTAPIARTAGTNQLRNPTVTGAVAGTPGTMPTNWGVFAPDVAKGITTQVIGSGTDGGIPYVDWRIFGTATAGATGQTVAYFDTAVSASVGQTWTMCAYVKVQAGSTAGIDSAAFVPGISLQLFETNSGSFLANDISYAFEPIAAPIGSDLHCYAGKTANGSTNQIQPNILITYTVGTPIDITLRLGAPSVDTGSIWSGVITKPGGYQGQIIWDAAGGPTSFTASGTYAWQRNLSSMTQPILANTVKLTGAPIILENQQWKGWAP